MTARPSFVEIVAALALASIMGALFLAVCLVVVSAISAIDLTQLEGLGFAIGFGVLLALFFVWPLGVVIGAGVGAIAGSGYYQATLAGAVVGLILAWLIGSPVEDGIPSLLGISAVALGILASTGAASALLAWHLIARSGTFNRADP